MGESVDDMLPHQTVERCELLHSVHGHQKACDGESCVYWRLLDHVGVTGERETGCALRFFGVLAETDPAVAEWLLSVKQRMEALEGPGSFPDPSVGAPGPL